MPSYQVACQTQANQVPKMKKWSPKWPRPSVTLWVSSRWRRTGPPTWKVPWKLYVVTWHQSTWVQLLAGTLLNSGTPGRVGSSLSEWWNYYVLENVILQFEIYQHVLFFKSVPNTQWGNSWILSKLMFKESTFIFNYDHPKLRIGKKKKQ